MFEQQYIDEVKRMEVAKIDALRTTLDVLQEVYPTPERFHFAEWRLEEFLRYTEFILHRRLQPGWAKVGKHLFLGQVPFTIFDHWFYVICNAT
jgi:hypothetical protein